MKHFPRQHNYEERAILGVHGYLRKTTTSDYPHDLVQLITVWYGTIDYWDMNNLHPVYHPMEQSQNTMKRTAQYSGLCYQLYGSVNIKKGDIKVWKLQLIAHDPVFGEAIMTTLIGIVGNNKAYAHLDGDFCDKVNDGYGISCYEGRKYHKTLQGFKYAEEIQINDIVIMELNMMNEENCTLTYKVSRNGVVTDYGFAFRKINANVQWRLAIGMYYKESIRLLQ